MGGLPNTLHGISHILIRPGKPMQNGYIESFDEKFRSYA
jgi:transposase InsO family protein